MDDALKTIKDSSALDVRYLLIDNKTTNDVIYPGLFGYYDNSGNMLPYEDLGFELKPGEFRVIKLPRKVISGRISARTGCQMLTGTYTDGNTSSDGLFCSTGDCRMPYPSDTYNNSKNGLLCQDIGLKPPTTVAEFTFDDYDFYDISQVDGNNIGVLIEPIVNGIDTPDGKDPKFWCKNTTCERLSEEDCPKELKVYDNDKKFVACQSICAAVSGMATNFDATGKQVGPPRIPSGAQSVYGDFTGPLKETDLVSYGLLAKMYKTTYKWDSSANIPDLKDDQNRPFTNQGRWKEQDCDVNEKGCITLQNLVCCDNKGTYCGDGLSQTPIKSAPTYKGFSDQGCSPYVLSGTFNDQEYPQHLCWSENWPNSSESLQGICKKNNIDYCNYASIFKNKCNSAYSWQFDDFSSTFICQAKSDGPPVHYHIQFFDKTPPPKPSPPVPPPKPSPPEFDIKLMLFGLGILILILILIKKIKLK